MDLARRYSEALAALRAVHAFDDWLGEHWHERCPPPSRPPSAKTTLGSGGEITWHETAGRVVGYIPGHAGCFRIARDADLPAFLFSLAPLAMPAGPGTDVLISASMRDEEQPPLR